jgi:hypothetical protein
METSAAFEVLDWGMRLKVSIYYALREIKPLPTAVLGRSLLTFDQKPNTISLVYGLVIEGYNH